MSQDDHSQALIANLAHLLDVYGADRARWPAVERLRVSAAVASDPDVRRMLAEASALDRVLDMAPRVSIERERALAERILAQARAAPGGMAPHTFVTLKRPAPSPARGLRPMAALLAASLVLGIVVGSSGAATPAVTLVAGIVGTSDDEAEIAASLTDQPSGDEETL